MKIAQIFLRRTASLRTSLRSVSQCCSGPKSMSTQSSKGYMDTPLYISSIDAEPLHRYHEGGYHPIILGEFLHSGRYKVLHKLGWGGYSTVWLARDQRLDELYVAIKIGVAEAYDKVIQELQVMKRLVTCCPRPKHMVLMLDHFHLKGPNGWHNCLVFELLGPNIPDIIDAHFSHGRLPGKLAKGVAKQSLIGLRSLHQHNVGHGGWFLIPRLEAISTPLTWYRSTYPQLGLYHTGCTQSNRGQTYWNYGRTRSRPYPKERWEGLGAWCTGVYCEAYLTLDAILESRFYSINQIDRLRGSIPTNRISSGTTHTPTRSST
ncbi:uncharacterized protein N7506_011514 [Penicillium brevicompactum]|uniref:uncharacterized protein n=1 Tax=Penicillium brevicompactum TaxID=5074 RepID=UPI0025407A8A|nr:uncharacterized protein N7506_011514 [Penicillium brevicompactum]KAJ5318810.1 hypothetical protein N7506_011514 [Penicillium brevicompactum]